MSEKDDPRTRAGETLVTITDAARTGGVTSVRLALESDQWPSAPVAPATLWSDEDSRVVELHKLIRAEGDSALFESYGLAADPPPPGGPFRMIGWWAPDQYAAATDQTIQWRRGSFERSGTWDHEHCLLTWDTINDGEPGYEAVPGGGWITVESYEKYIRDDVLRLRH